MAKFAFVAMLVVAAVAVVASAPVEEFEPLEMSQAESFTGEHFEDQEDHLRFRRVTCDLLSATGMVADTACAANCLSMGKAGGTCHGGVCQCRKTSFKDLWNQRFG